MAGKPIFDKEAAFKSIIGIGSEESEASGSAASQTLQEEKYPAATESTSHGSADAPAAKGRPKLGKVNKKRISLAVYPDEYNDLQKIAYVDRQSVSDIITRFISEYVKTNAHKIDEYNRLTGEGAE